MISKNLLCYLMIAFPFVSCDLGAHDQSFNSPFDDISTLTSSDHQPFPEDQDPGMVSDLAREIADVLIQFYQDDRRKGIKIMPYQKFIFHSFMALIDDPNRLRECIDYFVTRNKERFICVLRGQQIHNERSFIDCFINEGKLILTLPDGEFDNLSVHRGYIGWGRNLILMDDITNLCSMLAWSNYFDLMRCVFGKIHQSVTADERPIFEFITYTLLREFNYSHLKLNSALSLKQQLKKILLGSIQGLKKKCARYKNQEFFNAYYEKEVIEYAMGSARVKFAVSHDMNQSANSIKFSSIVEHYQSAKCDILELIHEGDKHVTCTAQIIFADGAQECHVLSLLTPKGNFQWLYADIFAGLKRVGYIDPSVLFESSTIADIMLGAWEKICDDCFNRFSQYLE